MSDQNHNGLAGTLAGTSDFNQMDFLIRRVISGMATSALVRVEAVNGGGVGPIGTVNVKPLVMQVDGIGNTTPHGIIHNLPYFRIVGGANAVIIDPQVGDIGLAVFASRDISVVKATGAESPPGSRRKNSWADGLFFGGFLSAAPQNYIQFDENGDIIMKPATKVSVIGDLDITGTATALVDVIGGGKSLSTHLHTGVTAGGGTSGPPA